MNGKLDDYDFPVYTTKVCPKNEAEWKERSSAINCTVSNGYMCMPNEDFTELLEFCYVYPLILVEEGICLYLYKDFSRVNGYKCDTFLSGCPKSTFVSYEMFKYPNCSSIGNGCFLAEPFCESVEDLRAVQSNNITGFVIFGVFAGLNIFFLMFFIWFLHKRQKNEENFPITIEELQLCTLHQIIENPEQSLHYTDQEENCPITIEKLQLCTLDQRIENLEQSLHYTDQVIAYDTKKLNRIETNANEEKKKKKSTDLSEINPIMVKSENGKKTFLEHFSEDGSVSVSEHNKCGISPLIVACESGRVQYLSTTYRNINFSNEEWFGPLYVACQNGHSDVAHRIMNTNAYGNFNTCIQEGGCLLFVACKNGHTNIVRLLLEKGVDVNFCNENGASSLYVACYNGHTRTVQLLLQNGADINLCSRSGTSPLYAACQNEHKLVVQILLNNGAKIDICDEYGASPLYVACQNGHDNIIKLLLDFDADINFGNKRGFSPLNVASCMGHESTTHLLLKNGADTCII